MSGQAPEHMGWTDEAYRDHGNVLGKGADQMHITGDLSLSDFALIEKNNDGYPKLADYLHAAYPGTSSSPWARSRTPWSRRPARAATSPCGCPDGEGVTRTPDGCRTCDPTPGTGMALPGRQERAGIYLRRHDPKLCGRFFINADRNNDYGDQGRLPVVALPGGRQPVLPGHDPATSAATRGRPTPRSR